VLAQAIGDGIGQLLLVLDHQHTHPVTLAPIPTAGC
jgi:hypothetical protein